MGAEGVRGGSARDVLATFLRVGAMNELQYRINLVLQLFQSVVALGTAVVVIGLVFLYTPSLGGWSSAELLVLVGVHTVLGGVIRAVIQPNMQQLMTDIQDGNLDMLLVKPVDAQLVISVRQVAVWQLVDVVVGLGVIVVGVWRTGAGVSVLAVLTFAVMLVLGAIVIYCFWLAITVAAFWVVRMQFAVELFNGLYQAGRWPVGLYPGWLRVLFTVLVPLAVAVTLPAEALTGRANLGTLALAAGFTLLLVVGSRALWRVGVRNYAGASA